MELFYNNGIKEGEAIYLLEQVEKIIYNDANQLEPLVMQKIKKGGSGQPTKDFEKEFYFNWRTIFLEDEMKLFYRVKKWIGEWCEENIENFSA